MGERQAWWTDDQQLRQLFVLAGACGVRGLQSAFLCPHILMGTEALVMFKGVIGHVVPVKKALLITDKMVAGLAERVGETLREAGFTLAVWDGVQPEPPLENVLEGVEFARNCAAGLIVAVGGGSVIDAAKAVWLAYERPDLNIRTVTPLEPLGLRKKALLAAVPTTAGTGSEATSAAIITDGGQKMALQHPELVPDFAILDPAFTTRLPVQLTVYTGLDVIAHATGGYLSHWANEYSEIMALKALEMAFEYLPRAASDGADLEARFKMLVASNMAGMAFSNAAPGLEHAMGHAFGKMYGVQHGAAVGLFTPLMVQYVARVTDRYMTLARFLGLEAAGAEELLSKLVGHYLAFIRSLGAPVTIAELGIDKERFEANLDRLVELTMQDGVTVLSSRPLNAQNYARLYRCAFDGTPVDF